MTGLGWQPPYPTTEWAPEYWVWINMNDWPSSAVVWGRRCLVVKAFQIFFLLHILPLWRLITYWGNTITVHTCTQALYSTCTELYTSCMINANKGMKVFGYPDQGPITPPILYRNNSSDTSLAGSGQEGPTRKDILNSPNSSLQSEVRWLKLFVWNRIIRSIKRNSRTLKHDNASAERPQALNIFNFPPTARLHTGHRAISWQTKYTISSYCRTGDILEVILDDEDGGEVLHFINYTLVTGMILWGSCDLDLDILLT